MKIFKLTEKEHFSNLVADRIERLYAIGLDQTKIAIYLGVSDRTIRKWLSFNTQPSGFQFYNLCRLCKELGA